MAMSTHQSINERGRKFEDLIEDLLNCLKMQNPGDIETTIGAVEVIRHPKIRLHDSEVLIPDFELITRLPHIKDHCLIECQDRERCSQEIVRKIRHIKSLSGKNRFFFVYNDSKFLTDAVKRSLDSDGINHYSLEDFLVFLQQMNLTLVKVRNRVKDMDKKLSDFQEKIREVLKSGYLGDLSALEKILEKDEDTLLNKETQQDAARAKEERMQEPPRIVVPRMAVPRKPKSWWHWWR